MRLEGGGQVGVRRRRKGGKGRGLRGASPPSRGLTSRLIIPFITVYDAWACGEKIAREKRGKDGRESEIIGRKGEWKEGREGEIK